MEKLHHVAVHISNKDNKENIIEKIMNGDIFKHLHLLKGELYSDISITEFINDELIHEHLEVAAKNNRSLNSLSDGEKKKALLDYIINKKPDYIIIDNIFDNLDKQSQVFIADTLASLSENIIIIQIANRIHDILPFINDIYFSDGNTIITHSINNNKESTQKNNFRFENAIPPPINIQQDEKNPLVQFRNVSASYDGRPIIKNINWQINKGEYWQLIGRNGSGKTTILSMITGDNVKAYGQDITLFGHKKGSGENVWQIKEKIGYFNSSIAQQFSRLHSIEQMVISGFYDSVGLYIKPTDMQIKLADEWLSLIGMLKIKQKHFLNLSFGHQRLVLIVRAMVKHPPLLILDEPVAGLDDEDVMILTALVNKIAEESNTTIIYVSHRTEPGLSPKSVFELIQTENGSEGRIVK